MFPTMWIKSDSQLIDNLISYAYNLASQITSITYPSTHVVVQNYDAIGRVCAIGASGSTCTAGTRYLNSLTYNAAGEALSVTFGNNVLGNFTYNDHLQLSTLRYFKGSTEILNLAYDYTSGVSGNNGQIQKLHYYTTPGSEDLTKSENFTYDQIGRLSAAQTGVVNSTSGAKTWSLQWTYDRFGNRLTQSMLAGDPSFPVGQPTLMINSATNQITNPGYTYDYAGNMTHDATAAYAYDGANRLTSVNTTAAVYSYFGPQRIKKVLGSNTTRYIYSGTKAIAEYTNTGNNPPTLSAEYVYAGSQLLVTIAGSTTTYHHPDHLSNRAETNSSGTRTRTFGQLPFGETWYETGTADKWKFTGYERDSGTGETGLNYANFRYHAPGLGRFTSADLLGGGVGAPQSLNRYTYALNDPVNLIDPLGLYCAIWELDYARVHGSDDPWTFMGSKCVLEIPDSPGFVSGGGGGGGGGGGKTKRPKPPQVDLGKLARCLQKLFHVSLVSFTPALTAEDGTNKNNTNGSFEGLGRDALSGPKDSNSDINIITDDRTKNADDLSKPGHESGDLAANETAYGGTPKDLTRVNGQYTNYAAWDQSQSQMLPTQIFELGNTLQYITTGQEPPKSEPGAKDLVNCYFGAGTSDKMSR
jgi:RHS repeat-associated protein